MTDTDQRRFTAAFNVLAVATRLPADEGDPAMKAVYWRGLADLCIEAVEQAATEIAMSAEWFPKLAEWREQAKHAEIVHQVKLLPAPRAEPWRFECERCEDAGWEILSCHPGTPVNCGRARCQYEGPYEHTYAVRCACVPTNRTIERRKRAQWGHITAS